MTPQHRATAWNIKHIDETGLIAGYASVFGVTDSQGDIVERGAFAEAVRRQGKGVPLLWQHDVAQPLGTIRALKEDAVGLYMEAQLILAVPQAQMARALLKAGALSGLSIGFSPKRWVVDAEGVRHLQEVRLWEISLVTFPANRAAGVTVVKNAPRPMGKPVPLPQAIRLGAAIEKARAALRVH